jgi:hypothetical protein
MNDKWVVIALSAALAAPLVVVGFTEAPGADEDRVSEAEVRAGMAGSCAWQLEQVVDADPRAIAQAIRIDPVRLAAFTAVNTPAEVRQAIAERLTEAQDNARAAKTLAALAVDGSEVLAAVALDRAGRSLAASRELCGAAAELPSGLALRMP